MLTPRYSSLFAIVACALAIDSANSFAQEQKNLPPGILLQQGPMTLTLNEVDAFAAKIPADKRIGYFDSPKRIEQTILALLLQKQLTAEARKLGIDNDAVVQGQMELAEREVLARVRMERFRDELTIPDFSALADEKYITNKEKYILHGKVNVKQILIDAKTRSWEEAHKLADQVRDEAKNEPSSFDALIAKYSEDPGKDKDGGLVKDAGGTTFQGSFAAGAWGLHDPGEISPVIKSPFGYHILQMVSKVPDRQQTFAEAKPAIVKELQEDYINKQVQAHVDQLRNLPFDASPELVASLRTRYESQAAESAGSSLETPSPDSSSAKP
ncbi:MAG: peptidylprolyl isomerase [Dokdonella sp.]